MLQEAQRCLEVQPSWLGCELTEFLDGACLFATGASQPIEGSDEFNESETMLIFQVLHLFGRRRAVTHAQDGILSQGRSALLHAGRGWCNVGQIWQKSVDHHEATS